MADEIKYGMRNSRADRERVRAIRAAARQIHDVSVELEPDDEDKAPEAEAPETWELPLMSADPVIFMGHEVKALGEGKVGGYLVRFTDADSPDVTGDFFTPATDFDLELPGKSTTYFNHGLDPVLGKKRLQRADLKADEFGVWAETILDERDRYERFLLDLAQAGKLGWSSGTAAHLVEREPAGKAQRITRWPLGLDASLTHTPAEPRNVVLPLKSFNPLPLEAEPESAEAAGDAARQPETDAAAVEVKSIEIEGVNKMEQEEVKTLIDAAVAEAVKGVVASLPPTNLGGYNVQVVTDEADRPFKSFSEQLKAVQTFATGGEMDPRLKALKQLGMNEGIPSEGGFLVETDFSGELLRRAYQLGQLASRVRKIQVSANANGLKINAVAETSRATGSRWGGVQAYWLAEAGTKLPSMPLFRQIHLDLHKLIGLCYATDELLQDTSALESVISQAFSEEFAFMLDDAIIRGPGGGQPLGFLTGPSLVTVAAEPLQPANSVVHENIVNMWSRLWAPSRANSVWIINQDVEPQLYTMGVAVGAGGMPSYMPPGGLSGAPYATLMGRPVLVMEQADTIGNVGDIMLVDPSQYVAIEKGGIQAASSIHVAFLTDQSAFRFVYRFDGQPMWHNTLTPANSANTLSPFVALAAR